ncbi:MAG: carbamoyl transferase [Elusimicrobia bacterium]|nr:carbamoyl transferase [Candidatus Liberimonas magnetica]
MKKVERSDEIYILGISSFMHDSSACLIKNGKIVAFAEEERFNREKHTDKFPEHAIKYCLSEAGINFEQVAYIGFFWKPWKGIVQRIWNLIKSYNFNDSRFGLYASYFLAMLSIPLKLRWKYGFKGKFFFITHHETHMTAAYYLSRYDDTAILSVDGTGEIDTVVSAVVEQNDYKVLSRSTFPDSLGRFYGAITEFLGFRMNADEGKVMGLSSYGEPAFYDTLKKLISVNKDGVLKVNTEHVNFNATNPLSWEFMQDLNCKRNQDELINKAHENLAASVQKVFEETLLDLMKHIRKNTSTNNLCLNGGVFLNCTANSRIIKESGFKNIFIFPIPNDAGTSIGAAYYIYHKILKNKDRHSLEHVYLGPKYSDDSIEKMLVQYKLKYLKTSDQSKKIAGYLAANKIVGWFQGAMEGGPRALGNRSILTSPINGNMKDILNDRVKHREFFRPFAPAVLYERKDDYFKMEGIDSPYMLFALPVKEEYKSRIPAVVHVDGTARVQTVKYEDNPLFYSLIKEFAAITGVHVILNTSFNVKGEPIVCSPEDAIKCYLSTNIDVLCLGTYIIEK